jgi:hypothetical protein
VADRTADEIQQDIEQARSALAVAVDQLAERTSPKRLADQGKHRLLEEARSPRGKAVIGAAGGLTLLYVIVKMRRRKH